MSRRLCMYEVEKKKYVKPLHEVFEAIADPVTDDIFRLVASNGGFDSPYIISHIEAKPTNKQYYSRISKLIETALIRRIEGKYVVTTFGRAVYKLVLMMEQVTNMMTQFKALDAVQAAKEIPMDEWDMLVETLLPDEQMRRLALA